MKSLEMYMNDLMTIILIIKNEKKRYYKNIIHLEYIFFMYEWINIDDKSFTFIVVFT